MSIDKEYFKRLLILMHTCVQPWAFHNRIDLYETMNHRLPHKGIASLSFSFLFVPACGKEGQQITGLAS